MRVLVATDLSKAADLALRAGVALAASPADALAVVHVLPPVLRALLKERDLNAGLVERATAAIRERLGGLSSRGADVFIEDGSEYAEILKRAAAWGADVIVIGSYGHSGLARVFGSVSERVARHAHCRVLVVRDTAARGWVLAATDMSDPSLAAISAGAEEARRRGARLEVVHVTGFLDVEATYLLELGSPSIAARRPDDTSSNLLAESVAKLGIDAVERTVEGSPAAAIVREAEAIGAELIVVGSHGRTGLAQLSLGGVAEKVVRAAPCSVLVVRPGSAGQTP